MAGSFVGAASGTTSATIPTHAIGDLIIARAFRDGNNNAPTIPSGENWVPLDNSAGSNSNGAALACKVATSTSEATGTWTSATRLDVGVWRGFSGCGLVAVDGAASTTVNYPTLGTLASPLNWAVAFGAHRSTNTALENAPSGMTNRHTNVTGTDEGAIHDTNGGVSSWSSTGVSVGGSSSGWRTHTIELVLSAGAYALSGGQGPFTLSGQAAALKHDWKIPAACGSLVLSGQDATLQVAEVFIADRGNFALSGQDAELKVTRLITAVRGNFALSGQNAFLAQEKILTAARGNFTLSGQDTFLDKASKLVADYGAIALSGQDAVLAVHRELLADHGSIALSGQDAALSKVGSDKTLSAGTGSFVLWGQDVIVDGVGSFLGVRLFGDTPSCYTFDT